MLPELKKSYQVSFDTVTLVEDLEKLTFQWNGQKQAVPMPDPRDGCKVDIQQPTGSPKAEYLTSISGFTPTHSPSSSFSSSSNSPNPFSSYYSNGYFEVRPSPKGGLGAFTIRDLPEGTIIIAEKPLFTVNFWEDVEWNHGSLSKEKKQAYATLHHWVGIHKDKVHGIYLTNRFQIGNRTGIFLNCSRFNHACHPHTTCTYKWDAEQECMVVSTIKDTFDGEELTISYMGWNVNQQSLKTNYGFECDCPGCLEAKAMEEEEEGKEKEKDKMKNHFRGSRPRQQVRV